MRCRKRAEEAVDVLADGGALAGFGDLGEGGYAAGFEFCDLDGLALARGAEEQGLLRGEGQRRGGMAGGEGFGEGDGVGVGLGG